MRKTVSRAVSSFAVACVVAAVAGGCASSSAEPEPGADGQGDANDAASASAVVQISGEQNGTVVSASIGQQIDITLKTIGPGEYRTPRVSAPVVEFRELVSPAAGVITPGGATQLFRLVAVAKGEAVITFENTVMTQPFTVTVDVG